MSINRNILGKIMDKAAQIQWTKKINMVNELYKNIFTEFGSPFDGLLGYELICKNCVRNGIKCKYYMIITFNYRSSGKYLWYEQHYIHKIKYTKCNICLKKICITSDMLNLYHHDFKKNENKY